MKRNERAKSGAVIAKRRANDQQCHYQATTKTQRPSAQERLARLTKHVEKRHPEGCLRAELESVSNLSVSRPSQSTLVLASKMGKTPEDFTFCKP